MTVLRAACLVLIALAYAALAVPAFADGHSRIPTPCDYPQGIDGSETAGFYHVDDWDGDVYSVAPDGGATFLFNIREATGEPYQNYHGNGLCFVPSEDDLRTGTLYVTRADRGGSPYTDYVRVFSTEGAHLQTYDVSDIVDRPHGITFDGTYFWLSGDAEFVKCDASFNRIASYVAPWGTGNGPLDYDPITNRLYSAGLGDGYITIMDLECNVVHQWYLNHHYRTGIAVGEVDDRGSRSLWVSDSTSVTIEETPDSYLAPVGVASWGELKALFR